MKRIATPNRAVDKFAAGKDGFRAAVAGVSSATEFSDVWFNAVQEAVVRVIEAAGLPLSDTDFDQFLTALRSPGVFQTAPQFDATTKVATTAAVKAASLQLSGVSIVGINKALTAADFGSVQAVNVASTMTLPVASASAIGQCIKVLNLIGTGSITVLPQGADGINGGASGGILASLQIMSGESATFCVGALGSWFVIDGLANAKNAQSFVASFAGSGYQKLPSGLIIQWGLFAGTAGSDTVTTLPIAFPNTFLSVFLTGDYTPLSGSQAYYNATPNGSLSTFVGRCTSNIGGRYLAIGK